MNLCLIARDALLPIYRIKRKSIKGLRIYVVIGGFSLLADALLRGSSVLSLSRIKEPIEEEREPAGLR